MYFVYYFLYYHFLPKKQGDKKLGRRQGLRPILALIKFYLMPIKYFLGLAERSKKSSATSRKREEVDLPKATTST